MSTRTRRRSGGFSLYEVVVTVFLLGIAVHPLVTTLGTTTQSAADRGERLVAERLLRNEVALVLAADPVTLPASRSYRADRAGRQASAGTFLIAMRREVRCGVGPAPTDNQAEPPAGCVYGGAVADVTVTVVFANAAGVGTVDTLARSVSVPVRGHRGATLGGAP